MPTIESSVVFSVYEALPAAIIAQAALDAVKAMELRSSLMDALYEIRDSTAAANIEHGISRLVSRKARIEKDIAFYTAQANASVRPADAVILARIERAKTVNPDHYSYNETTSVPVFPQASIDSLKLTLAELKKEKVKLQDALLELNIKHNIRLSDETVAVLTAQGLI